MGKKIIPRPFTPDQDTNSVHKSIVSGNGKADTTAAIEEAQKMKHLPQKTYGSFKELL